MSTNPAYQKIVDETGCLSTQVLFDYIDKKLTAAQVHEVEMHLTDCALCSDALEGLLTLKNRSKVETTRQAVATRAGHSSRRNRKIIRFDFVTRLAIAASIVLCVGTLIFIQYNQQEKGPLALQETSETPLLQAAKENNPALNTPPTKSESAVSGSAPPLLQDKSHQALEPIKAGKNTMEASRPMAGQEIKEENVVLNKVDAGTVAEAEHPVAMTAPAPASDEAVLAAPIASKQAGKKAMADAREESNVSASKISDSRMELYRIGIRYFRQHDFDKALSCFDKLLLEKKEDAYTADAQWHKALCLVEKREVEAAKNLLEKIVENNGVYARKAAEKLRDLK